MVENNNLIYQEIKELLDKKTNNIISKHTENTTLNRSVEFNELKNEFNNVISNNDKLVEAFAQLYSVRHDVFECLLSVTIAKYYAKRIKGFSNNIAAVSQLAAVLGDIDITSPTGIMQVLDTLTDALVRLTELDKANIDPTSEAYQKLLNLIKDCCAELKNTSDVLKKLLNETMGENRFILRDTTNNVVGTMVFSDDYNPDNQDDEHANIRTNEIKSVNLIFNELLTLEDGSEDYPYIIRNKQDWDDKIFSTERNCYGSYYKLVNDIDIREPEKPKRKVGLFAILAVVCPMVALVAVAVAGIVSLFKKSKKKIFYGILEGNGHTITCNTIFIKELRGGLKNLRVKMEAPISGLGVDFILDGRKMEGMRSSNNMGFGLIEHVELIRTKADDFKVLVRGNARVDGLNYLAGSNPNNGKITFKSRDKDTDGLDLVFLKNIYGCKVKANEDDFDVENDTPFARFITDDNVVGIPAGTEKVFESLLFNEIDEESKMASYGSDAMMFLAYNLLSNLSKDEDGNFVVEQADETDGESYTSVTDNEFKDGIFIFEFDHTLNITKMENGEEITEEKTFSATLYGSWTNTKRVEMSSKEAGSIMNMLAAIDALSKGSKINDSGTIDTEGLDPDPDISKMVIDPIFMLTLIPELVDNLNKMKEQLDNTLSESYESIENLCSSFISIEEYRKLNDTNFDSDLTVELTNDFSNLLTTVQNSVTMEEIDSSFNLLQSVIDGVEKIENNSSSLLLGLGTTSQKLDTILETYMPFIPITYDDKNNIFNSLTIFDEAVRQDIDDFIAIPKYIRRFNEWYSIVYEYIKDDAANLLMMFIAQELGLNLQEGSAFSKNPDAKEFRKLFNYAFRNSLKKCTIDPDLLSNIFKNAQLYKEQLKDDYGLDINEDSGKLLTDPLIIKIFPALKEIDNVNFEKFLIDDISLNERINLSRFTTVSILQELLRTQSSIITKINKAEDIFRTNTITLRDLYIKQSFYAALKTIINLVENNCSEENSSYLSSKDIEYIKKIIGNNYETLETIINKYKYVWRFFFNSDDNMLLYIIRDATKSIEGSELFNYLTNDNKQVLSYDDIEYDVSDENTGGYNVSIFMTRISNWYKEQIEKIKNVFSSEE